MPCSVQDRSYTLNMNFTLTSKKLIHTYVTSEILTMMVEMSNRDQQDCNLCIVHIVT